MLDSYNKILTLPFGEYYSVFKKLIVAGRKNKNWDVHSVAISKDFKPFVQFLDSDKKLLVAPDFQIKQEWEDHVEQVAAIQKLMTSAEFKAGVPLSRILLSCERDIGRAYSKSTYYWPELDITRKVLKDKKSIDAILMRAFKYANDVITQVKPELCLGAAPSGLINGVFYFLSQHYGIPYIACMLSATAPGSHYWSQSWGSFNRLTNEIFQKKLDNNSKPTSFSVEHIDNFRKMPEPLPIYKKIWRNEKTGSFYGVSKLVVQRLIFRLVPILKGVKVLNPKPFFSTAIDLYRIYFLRKIQDKFYMNYTGGELSSFKYLYYPMHQDPEFVLNVRGTFWYNQLNTIRMLSYNLPVGFKLIVREHRNNVGRRSTRYLKEISRLPGVVLVDAYDDQYKYINNAELIVTVNGSTGLEGLLLKKNVLTLDKTAYDALNMTYKVSDPSQFGDLILKAIKTEARSKDYDQKLALFYDAEREASFPDDADPMDEISHIVKLLNKTDTRIPDEVC